MRAIRFRCPRCRVHHTASIARAGQPFACSSCFAPMAIPESTANPPAEAPIARSIEVAPPAIEAAPSTPNPATLERPSSPRPRRPTRPKPAPSRPSTPIERLESPPEPRPKPQAEPTPVARPIETGATSGSPTGPARVPSRRVALALASVLGLAVGAVGVGAILESGKPKEPAAVARPEPAAIVEAPRHRVAAGPPRDMPTPTTPAPIVAAPAASSPRLAAQSPPASPIDVAAQAEPAPRPEESAPAPEPDPARPLVIRRRQLLDQEALRRQLADLPEIRLSHLTEGRLLLGHGLPVIPHNLHHRPAHRAQPTRGFVGQPGFLAPVLNGNGHSSNRPGLNAPGPNGLDLFVEDDEDADIHVAHPKDHTLATLTLFRRLQPELAHLPWRMGEDCHLPREAAEELEVQSRSLRNQLQAAIPEGDTRPDADALRASLSRPSPAIGPGVAGIRRGPGARQVRSDVAAAIPGLMQLLMAERTPARMVLVEVLARIDGPAASKALARLAIFDLAPEVRERALVALRDRPAADSRPSLLEGLRHPWPPAADHAAEALVALGDRQAIPALIDLLDQPDPAYPRTELRDGQPVTYARTLVQVNHLRNCLLCHAPSTSPTTDLVRGRVPTEGTPLPPPQEYYASTSPGAFVRAEVTYLRQDFSTTQPVEQSGPWPGYQRYDYLVSEWPVHAPTHPQPHPKGKARPKAEGKATFPQRESTLFALRGLTGQDLGDESAAWKDADRPKPPVD